MERFKEKKETRNRVKKEINQLEPEIRLTKSKQIVEKVLTLEAYQKAQKLFCYVAKSDEVQTSFLIQKALEQKKEVFVPRVSEDSKIELFQIFNIEQDLEKGCFGLLEPKKEATQWTDLNQIDLFILPGLGFDTQGNRLGRGKGMFDQFLALFESNKRLMALAFECQILPSIPNEAHDIRVDQIITENRLLEITKGS